jgi:glycine cleavage system regulatory protein/folate-dependent phosphoribosylglycinamide formyltransferase PurN
MNVTLVGSRYFGAAVFAALRTERDVAIVRVVAPAADDRLAVAATAASVPVHVLENPKIVPGEAIAGGTDLIVAAHTHARVSPEALAQARHGGIGYHPSLLPRHRGIAAVEWTILEGDPIAGGSVYHLADGWDAGPLAAQDWCFVARGETARELWERALAPMGLALLSRVVRHVRDHDELPAFPQDERYATRAPLIKRSVTLSEAPAPDATSLVVTVVAPDRPGIVRVISERAKRFGANWAASRMTSLQDQFAGIVHLQVPTANADALTASLRALESTGLSIVIARTDARPVPPGRRIVRLELSGVDRPGIVSDLSTTLAERGVSIEDLYTEVVEGEGAAGHQFRVKALLFVPTTLDDEGLRRSLDALAATMKMDLALEERSGAAE